METGSNIEESMTTYWMPHKYAFTWVINNFSNWRVNVEGKIQRSKEFPSGTDDKFKWVLKFYPQSEKDKNYCSLFLFLISKKGSQDKVFPQVELKMENSTGETIRQRSLKHGFFVQHGRGLNKWIRTDKLLEAVKDDDQLVIKCKILVEEVINSEVIRKHLPKPLVSSLSKDYNTLVDGQKFGDVTILIDGHRFLAYKGILAARSAVFAAMFDHQMQETIQNCVTISDVEPNVFKELLRYIYTDELSSLGTMAHSLYTAADKYAMPTLKSLCLCHILEKLNWESAAETLVLAEMHNDQEMKKHALRFLSGSEAGKVTESGGWKNMVRTHPYLVDEMVKALAACRIAQADK
ncbi:speckle-type POZ protein B-like [Culex quinquefasciatus]|uniref:speckle-type POZ protein B-like n=1 Tax=Culex quinquefasciatus TaxID=7176 RepID=UPI0018E347CB|nr:speckle-type POZ protein B-like [Culex quinquefasciatus]